ncbi:MAG: tripartite tricarboxylate transporter substrate binding protein [Alphaproteobacteria bacterium]|nr:tripartite tricarboxylate transporter substrate binding protein [Alphaproteobacteria bacterium]
MTLIRTTLSIFAACMTGVAGAAAQDFPSRPVTVVVPFPAGGSADVLPRIAAEYLSQKWKQQVVIENKPGAGGNIGATQVFRAAPDGYTLLSAPPPPLAVNQSLYAKLQYDPEKFEPITILASAPNVLAVSTKLGVKTVAEFVAHAKQNPGKLNVASQGNGSTSHLTFEMFQVAAGVKFNHVPYKGTAPAQNDLAAGHVDLFFDNISSSLPLHQGGRIRILAVASASRSQKIPGVPTIAESGFPGFSATAWFGVVAPPGTPKAITDKLSADFREALAQASVRERYLAQDATPIGNTPQEAAQFMAQERKLWAGVIRNANIRIGN